MEKLIIDKTKPFGFSAKVVYDYGHFEIRQQLETSSQISEFTIGDIMFFDAPSDDLIKASDFKKMVLEAGYVPLDIYCARAIYENKQALLELSLLWLNSSIDASDCELDNILFLGTVMARDSTDVDHFSIFKYKKFSDQVEFIPVEDDPFFLKNRDFIPVFKKSFIKQF